MKTALKLAMAALAFASFATVAHAGGDAEKGKKVFKKCKACHAVGENAKNKVGPVLNDVMGRKAGTYDGFKYSKAMKEAGEKGLVWNHDTLAKYLEKPRKFLPKTKMAFAGLKKEKDRENVIAYLETFSKDKK